MQLGAAIHLSCSVDRGPNHQPRTAVVYREEDKSEDPWGVGQPYYGNLAPTRKSNLILEAAV
jgi:hypothetical protein